MQAIDEKIIDLAHRMADSAGDILRHYFRALLPVESKADASPVTRADREVETAIRALIEQHYPEHGIVGEEFGNLRPSADFQWVIDPIDGTHAFIAGQATFTTLIALAYKGVPLLGIIDQPITGERWLGLAEKTTLYTCHSRAGGNPALLAEQGQNIFSGADAPLLDSRLRGNDKKLLAHSVIATTSTDYFTPAQAAAFDTLKRQCHDVVLGGDAYAYAMLASGQVDIVVDAGMKPYDFCALRPVVEGAGGVITDWNGALLTIKSDGCVIAAATKELHAQALSFLRMNY